MRRNTSNKGFTLIELLIVIAIIGILAAVLIPNLLNARASAQERAAEAYMRNVATAATATLASDIDLDSADITMADCKDSYTTTAVAAEGYALGDPGASVASCEVIANGADNFIVNVTSIGTTAYSFP